MFPELLERVKIIIGLEFEIEYDDALNEFINNLAQMVNLYVGTEELPIELQFVVVEGAVARYRKMGSEGYTDESIDVISISYEEHLAPYIPYLEIYKKNIQNVKFL